MRASHMNPGQARACCSGKGMPSLPDVSAASDSSGSTTAAAVPARRAAPPGRVTSRTRRRHTYQCAPK
ncbi:hypothetical protein K701_17405 [Streptomyces fradiae ATCC 10745 = DSM 40063]|uniref:Uncharacterized protein n=1 Tax=Streptomyces fradiae ATCC 10745 = DSM 40063 TaxID=1319510 RepID=A0ABQ6XSM8_STRFR|nr:hypothetical protein K701_17405 [Streptomyces fradiae ATCC 10745 = DSM 40063]